LQNRLIQTSQTGGQWYIKEKFFFRQKCAKSHFKFSSLKEFDMFQQSTQICETIEVLPKKLFSSLVPYAIG
jgi:hypothetical protein